MISLPQIRVDYTDFKEYIKIKGWDQKKLAKQMGIDNSTISYYVSNGKPMSGPMIIAIAKLTQMRADQVSRLLLGGQNE